MRSLELLLTAVRRETDNLDFDSTTGIQDDEIIQYANDAQDEILSQIHMQHPLTLVKESVIDLTQDTEAVDLPFDVFLGERIVNVMYSQTGNQRDYYQLKKGSPAERFSGFSAEPSFYIRRGGQILLQPPPQAIGAKLRIIYQKALPRLDIRLAKIGAVTTVGSAITALTLDTSFPIKSDELVEEEFFTVFSQDGTVTMKSIPISSVDETVGTVTLGSFTFEDGETIAAGDYVGRGKNTTSVSQLPDICERYLLAFMCWKILKRDSSDDAMTKLTELTAISQTIVDSFKEPDDDVDYIPIIDNQFLDDGWL